MCIRNYVEQGNVYELRAEAFVALNNKAAATVELEGYAKAGGRDPAALKKLATLLEESGRPVDAAKALDRITYIYPMDPEVHQHLGTLWLDQGNREGAIREFTAALASKPIDLAASHYNLARAYRSADRPADAKERIGIGAGSRAWIPAGAAHVAGAVPVRRRVTQGTRKRKTFSCPQ